MAIKILTYTTLYPNNEQPHHGIFVENRLRHLLDISDGESKVVAPVPWFPFRSEKSGGYSTFARVVKGETRHDIDIVHPRYLVLPKIGMVLAPFLLAMGSLRCLKNIIQEGYDFDIIDAHYFYPDGVAAVLLGLLLKKPVVITARGTDVNLIPRYSLPRKMILWSAARASAVITVCTALKDELVDLGTDHGKITVLRNGVDLKMFILPDERQKLRMELGIYGKIIFSVGHLIKRKGHELVIKALIYLPDTKLLIAGIGREEQNLRVLVKKLHLEERVVFLGLVSHRDLARYYGAVDLTVLASEREGWANVLLESMACGTPVVATNIWGTPEVVAAPEAGCLAAQRTDRAIAAAIQKLYDNYPSHKATRKYAEKFSWDATSEGQMKIFSKISDTV